MKDIESLVKQKHIVSKTDKSDKLCLLTEEDYVKIGQPHVTNDEVQTDEDVKKSEDILNCHAQQMCRLLGLCDGQDCSRRLKSAILNQNTRPPSLYFLIKDHKPIVPGAPLPARPVCGAVRAHNGQLGFMLAQVLDAAAEILAREHRTECNSTQDMIASIEDKVNRRDLNTRELVVFSTDVVSLYPRQQAIPCAAIIARMLREGRLVVEGVHWDEAALYLALTLTRARVEELGLEEVVPRRKGTRGRAPGITTKEVRGPLQQEKVWDSSLFHPPTRQPTEEERKVILSLCVEEGLLAALGSHTYTWNKEVKLQGSGLPIGLDLTRAVARLVLLDWDQQFLRLARANQLELFLYSRFVDDTANAMEGLAPGLRWSEEEGRMILHPHLVEEDLHTAPDIRTSREVARMGSSISPMVELTADCPSSNPSGMMPCLDLQVWVEGNTVLYQHYRKPMANPLLMLEMSAMPASMKRTALTQEVIRILRNCRPGLSPQIALKHLDNFSHRMKTSGYDSNYRLQVIRSGMVGYDRMVEEERRGGRPINMARTWEEDRRQKNKELQAKNWYRKGGYDVPLFVPHTPGGELARRMRTKEAENNQGRRVRVKIVEKGGVTLEQKLRRSNPWSGGPCGRAQCFPCMREGGGDCWVEGVAYSLWCLECGYLVARYCGETGRNAFTRGREHLDSLAAKDESTSVLWLHSIFHHQRREDVSYSMRVTSEHQDSLSRQVTEMVNISNFEGPILMNRRNEMAGVRVERMQYRRWGVAE